MAFQFLGIKSFGEAEFWLALIKVLSIVGFFLCAILISTGVIGGEKIGFKFFHEPGAFANGVKGVFQVFVFAALQYSGSEMVGLTAGESNNPAKDVPKAVRSVIWRILLIFLGDIFFLTITVPWNDPNLLGAHSKTGRVKDKPCPAFLVRLPLTVDIRCLSDSSDICGVIGPICPPDYHRALIGQTPSLSGVEECSESVTSQPA